MYQHQKNPWLFYKYLIEDIEMFTNLTMHFVEDNQLKPEKLLFFLHIGRLLLNS